MAIFYAILLLSGCSEEPDLDNPFDSESDDFIGGAEVSITSDSEGQTLSSNTISIAVDGNQLVNDIRVYMFSEHNFENNEYLNYTSMSNRYYWYYPESLPTSISLLLLDDGEYTLYADGRYDNNYDWDGMDEISFTIDAVPESSIKMYPLSTLVHPDDASTSIVSASIFLEDVENVKFIETQIEYSYEYLSLGSSPIEYDSANLGSMFDDVGPDIANEIAYSESVVMVVDEGESTLLVNIAVVDSDDESNNLINGSGELFVLNFNQSLNAVLDYPFVIYINITNTVFRDQNNNEIPINAQVGGHILRYGNLESSADSFR